MHKSQMNNKQTQISLERIVEELRHIGYLLKEVNDNVKKSNLLLEHDMSIEKTIRALPANKSNELDEHELTRAEQIMSSKYGYDPANKSNQLREDLSRWLLDDAEW